MFAIRGSRWPSVLLLPHLPCDSECHVLNPGDFYRTSDRCSLWQSSKPCLPVTCAAPLCPSGLERLAETVLLSADRTDRPAGLVSHPPGYSGVGGPLQSTEPGWVGEAAEAGRGVLSCAETLAMDQRRKWLTKWRLKSADWSVEDSHVGIRGIKGPEPWKIRLLRFDDGYY